MAEHLEAVMRGQIKRLIFTLPPRCMKSLMVSVTFPAFVWAQSQYGALSGPHVKFAGVAYDPKLAIRDAIKERRLLLSPWYRDRWGDRFELMPDKDTKAMYENTAGGFRFSTSVGGSFTGEGADIISVDDSISAKKAQWTSAREAVNEFWDETVPTRLNQQKTGAKIVTAQRLHEDDLIGHILAKAEEDGEEWVHVNFPMEYDSSLDTRTWVNGHVFFEDPRIEDGELLWEDRFPRDVVDKLKTTLGPFAASAQLQQSPTPRGGGIIDRLWWQVWPAPGFSPLQFPPCSLIVGSVDTAYGEKDENAYNAMTVMGLFTDQRQRINTVLMEGWRRRVPLRGVIPEDCKTDDERKPHWGLAEYVADTVRRRQLDVLLIENKTRGGDLEKELQRLLRNYECSIVMIEPEGNKVARLHACQPMFADGRVWAPEKAWAETIITEVSQFPKSKYADYTDTISQMIIWMRNSGALMLGVEADAENIAANTFRSQRKAAYDV